MCINIREFVIAIAFRHPPMLSGEAIAGFGVNYVIILSVEKYFRLYN